MRAVTLGRVCVALTLAGCAPTLAAPAAPPPSGGAAPARSAREPARVFDTDVDDATSPFQLQLQLQLNYGVWEVFPRGEVSRLLARGVRVEVDANARVTESAGSFVPREWMALRRGEGWRFLSGASAWDADTFVAPLRFAARARRGRLGDGAGRVVEIYDGRVEGLSLPTGVVIDIAFSDDLRGVALMEPGSLLVTSDGGERWDLVSGGRDAVRVAADHQRRWAMGDSRAYVIEGLEAVAVPGRDAASASFPSIPAARDAAAASVQRSTAWRSLTFVDARRRTVLLTSRTINGRDLYAVYDLAEGRVIGELSPPTDCASPEFFFAGRLYVTCAGERSLSLHESDDFGRWSSRLTTRSCASRPRCAASADGRRVACEGRCLGVGACSASLSVCERESRAAPRERVVGAPAEPWRLAGYEGDAPLFVEHRRFARRARFLRGDGAASPLLANPEREGWVIVGDAPRVGSDGEVRLVVREFGSNTERILSGRAGERFAVLDAPPWVGPGEATSQRLCSADGDALAVAPDGTPWLSTRAQPAWHPFVSPRGDAYLRGRHLPRPADPGATPTCDATSWQWAISVVGWGEPTLAPEVEVSPESPSAAPTSVLSCESTNGAQTFHDEVVLRWGRSWVRSALGIHVTARSREGYDRTTEFVGVPEDRHETRSLIDATTQSASLLVLTDSASTLFALSPRAPPVARWVFPAIAFWASSAPPFVARDGASIAALLLMSPDERGVARHWLLSHTARHPMTFESAPFAAATSGWLGVYAMGGDTGTLRLLADGTALASHLGARPRVIARGTRFGPCPPDARGDFVLRGPIIVADDPLPGESRTTFPQEASFVRMQLSGDALCVRAVTHGGSINDPFALTSADLPRVSCELRTINAEP
ncbi:MAG: hypothetical protein R3A52_18975 [Polyangiales bacterium]